MAKEESANNRLRTSLRKGVDAQTPKLPSVERPARKKQPVARVETPRTREKEVPLSPDTTVEYLDPTRETRPYPTPIMGRKS